MAIEVPPTHLQDEVKTHQYVSKLPEDISVARKLLEEYSGTASEEVIPRILAVVTTAKPFSTMTPTPALQASDSSNSTSPNIPYPTILSRLSGLTSNQNLLDIGCCFGQDLRHFALDGARTQNLFGADLHHEILDLGFELFKDRELLGHHFVAGDIFATGGEIDKLAGKMDIISATAFLHLFSREDQIKVCERIISFLKPISGDERFQQVVFGRQSASTKPGARVREEVKWGRQELFLHDVESFKELWDEVGEKTGTKWEVVGELRGLGKDEVKGIEDPETARLLIFSVFRIDQGAGRELEEVDGEMSVGMDLEA